MISKVIFKKLLLNSKDFCCLCLNESVDRSIQIQDKFSLENPLENGDYLNAFHLLLGEELMDNLSSFSTICIECVKEALKSYKFILRAKQNIKDITQSIQSLHDSINNLTDFQDKGKTVFIDILTNETFYEEHSYSHNTAKACKRFLKIKRNGNHLVNGLKCKKCSINCQEGERNLNYCKFCSGLQEKFSCSYCPRCFETHELLQEHNKTMHAKMMCNTCGKLYQSQKILMQHKKIHTESMICPKCGRLYKTCYSLKQHIDSNVCHQPIRPPPNQGTYICDYCGKRYTQKMSLRVHIQYEHLNYKAHVCKYCKKKFWALSRLKIHLNKHTKQKDFTCNICGGKYVTKQSLLCHTRIHTGEKPYRCKDCGDQFVSASRRWAHYQRCHLNQNFPCTMCEATFPSKYKLKKHMHMKHLDILVPKINSGE